MPPLAVIPPSTPSPKADPSGEENLLRMTGHRYTAPDDIERHAGYVTASYECVYNAVQGTLYAGNRGVYFVGTFFLFERTLALGWDRIRQVQKLNHGVAIVSKDHESVVHSFVSMPAPARAWVVLVSLHNEALLDHRPWSSPTDRRTTLRRSIKRRNSDPMNKLAFLDALQDPDEAENAKDGAIRWEDSEHHGETDPSKTPLSPAPKVTIHEPTVSPQRPVIDWFKEWSFDPRMDEILAKVGRPLRIEGLRCSYKNDSGITLRGKLYAGAGGLYFFGKRLAWETERLFIPFHLIRQLQIQRPPEEEDMSNNNSKTRGSKRHGISITTKEAIIYNFGSMENADRLWASLIALQNENLATQGASFNRRQSLRRMNSDPMIPSRPSFEGDLALETSTSNDVSEPSSEDQASIHSFEAPNVANEWASEVAKQKDYSHTVVREQTLHCTMDKFYELFIANEAPYSMANFLESRGDLEMEVSEWDTTKQAKDPDKRMMHYKHPVNAPLAPPMAGARKEQSFRRYDDHGMCLETKTFVDDVPMADCFYVADRIRVAPKGKGAVKVTMEFDITFIKSTMFKSIIGKTTRSEFTDLFENRK